MQDILDRYDVVVGLEVHAQLQTLTKAYASDKNEFGAIPNTNVSPITIGHPGTLPRSNKKVIEYAVKLGLALKSDITRVQHYDRKNYFYPDLPKGYQITQDATPICWGGSVEIKLKDGTTKNIDITRVHMEEDAGKSIHDQDPYNTLVDLNRAGVPLVEIVTEPVINSADEAYAYLIEIRKLVRYLDICDGNMEEGSMRCDANISIMPKGSKEFGNRVEVKNMNSIRNVHRAIEHEIKRQAEIYDNGGSIQMQTRTFNAVDGSTSAMRDKEGAHDYRYFPEPDLQPLAISQEYIDAVEANLPPLPNFLFKKYTNELGLSDYDAGNITDTKEIALYFEELISNTKNYKGAANWLMGSVKSHLNQNALTIDQFPIKASSITDLIALIDEGKVSNSVATQNIFPILVENPEKSPLSIAEENGWIQSNDSDFLADIIKEVIAENPDEVERYKGGNKALTGFFMGQVMRKGKGKADPKSANKLLAELLDKA